MKKFFRKKWVQCVLFLVAAVILCGIASRLTSGFTVFDVEEMFSVKLNEDNYFYEKIDDGVFYSDANVDAVADKGIITFNGEIPDTDASAVTVAEEIELATIQLKAGTYTFTCFDNEKPTWKTYYMLCFLSNFFSLFRYIRYIHRSRGDKNRGVVFCLHHLLCNRLFFHRQNEFCCCRKNYL